MLNAEQNGNGKSRALRSPRRSFCALPPALCTLRSRSAFTLIELLVAVGLMAILLTMIAVIFLAATQGFRAARASIEIHESARSALNALLNDITAAQFATYDNGAQGYFALSAGPADPALGSAPPVWNLGTSYAVNNRVVWNGNAYVCVTANVDQLPSSTAYWQLVSPGPLGPNGLPIAVDTLTFTTLAAQPGARFAAATEAVEQLALVRYALEWDGGSATLSGGKPRPTYNLVKRVRFPCTSDPNLNMDQFAWAVMGANGQPLQPYQYLLPLEYTLHTSPPLASTDPDVVLDAAGQRYAQSEVIAFHVLSMNIRLFCLPEKQATESSQAFLDTGYAASNGNTSQLIDPTKNWPNQSFSGGGFAIRIIAGTDAGQWLPISSASGSTVTCTGTWTTAPDNTSQYRIEELVLVGGTATSATNNSLTDLAKNWPANSFAPANGTGFTLRIIAGTGAGQPQPALSISGITPPSTVTCSGAWATAPDNTSQYRIEGLVTGTATSAANTPASLTDTTQNWPIGSYSGGFALQITGGTGAGQPALPIVSAIGSTVTCSGTWTTVPDTTSQYAIVPAAWNPAWYQRGNYNFLGTTYRPPAVVEVTLEMTDVRATHAFMFTQRFYVQASER